MMPRIAAVVTTRNDAAQIGDCLASLHAQDYPRDRREIVIVDRGSTDTTRKAAALHGVRVVDGLGLNVSAARNAGAAILSADVVAFTDPDCVVASRWMSNIAQVFDDPTVGAVAGAVVPFPPRTLAERYAARRRSHSPERAVDHQPRPFGLSPNLAVRRDALCRIGGFDARFPGGGWEDADLCWRLQQDTPYRLVFAPSAIVFHRYRASALGFVVQHFRYGYGLALLRRKHGLERIQTGVFGGGSVERRGGPEVLGFFLLDVLRALGQRSGSAVGLLSGT
jgi:GT2 family glycosyltransferase